MDSHSPAPGGGWPEAVLICPAVSKITPRRGSVEKSNPVQSMLRKFSRMLRWRGARSFPHLLDEAKDWTTSDPSLTLQRIALAAAHLTLAWASEASGPISHICVQRAKEDSCARQQC